MVDEEKQSLLNKIERLERQLLEAKAHSPVRMRDSIRDLLTAGKDHRMASGVIITITGLGGDTIIKPTTVFDGLSPTTIESLRADIKSSLDQMV